VSLPISFELRIKKDRLSIYTIYR